MISIESITGCKCLNPVTKYTITKGISFLSNDAIENIKKIQQGQIDIEQFQKMRGLLNYINSLERVKKSVQSTKGCSSLIPRRLGDCSCLNPVTRKFILGSIDEMKNRETSEDIKERIVLIKRDVINIQDCK